MLTPFPCNQCGLCCRSVHLSEVTNYLNRGDGTCRHFDDVSRLCQIYAQRPEICRVDKMYQQHYQASVTWGKFVEINIAVCQQLQHSHQGDKP